MTRRETLPKDVFLHHEGPVRQPNGWPLRLAIGSQYEARQWFAPLGATHVLSIRRPDRPCFQPNVDPPCQLVLGFEDVVDAEHPFAPRPDHLIQAEAFIDSLPNDARLIVHCLQGLSRSTAMALGLLAREVGPHSAVRLLYDVRPMAMPNPLIVRLWDERLSLGGELSAALASFR